MNKCISLTFVAAVVAAGAVFADAAYEDVYLTSSDAAVKRIATGDSIVYVFANPAAGSVNVTLKQGMTLERYLVVGGGGAGGWTIGAGGGAGGFTEASPAAELAANTTLTLAVGAGGDPQPNASGTTWPRGGNGGASTLVFGETSVTALGGGGGGSWTMAAPNSGTLASGGGCAHGNTTTTPEGTTYTGNVGGTSSGECPAGGGGAGGPGGAGASTTAGMGGFGRYCDITGEELDYASGGGGGAGNSCATAAIGGGASGGNGGTKDSATKGSSGLDGRGGGGGGGGFNGATCGGYGGCGTVILRFAPAIVYPRVTLDDRFPRYRHNGTLAFAGSVDSTAHGTTTVTALWGYSADSLTETTIATFAEGAATKTFSQSISGIEPDRTVYCKVRAVNQQGGSSETVESELQSFSTTFVPTDAATPIYNIVLSGTKELSAWMAEQATPIEEITGGGTIVVSGGTLTVTDTVLSGFTGDVYIKSGARVKTNVANPLGPASSGKIVVAYGATLETTWPDADHQVSFGNKPVYIAGTGTDGKGAIFSNSLKTNGALGHPGKVYLTDDAKGSSSNHSRVNGSIYLEGYTFTVDYAGGWTYLQQGYYDSTGRGNIAIAREILWEGSPSFNFGGATNTIYIRTGATLRCNNHTQNRTRPWRLVMEGTAGFNAGLGTATWYGEVLLTARHWLTKQDGSPTFNLRGPVTGPGGIGNGSNTDATKIGLFHPRNNFKGGVYLRSRNTLTLGCNGALPADGAAFTNQASTVQFSSQTDFYDLPEAYFVKTGMVTCATAGGKTHGAWRRQLVKSDTGMLLYDSQVGSSNLVVTGGSVKFPMTDAADLPMFTNVQVRTGTSIAFGDGFAGAWAVPNLKSGGGTIGGAVAAAGFVVDPAAVGETLTVGGALTFANGSRVEVPADLPHRPTKVYTLVTANSITGVPRSTDKNWHAEIVGGNGPQSLQLVYSSGTTVIMR